MASFFVKPDHGQNGGGRNAAFPVILGCNILRAIAESSMDAVGPTTPDWQLALRWMRLSSGRSSDGHVSPHGRGSVDAFICEPITVARGEVIAVECQVRDADSLDETTVVSEAGMESSVPLRVAEGVHSLREGIVEVAVTNHGSETVSLLASSRLLTVRSVSLVDEVVLSPTSEVVTVSVLPLLVEGEGEASDVRQIDAVSSSTQPDATDSASFTFPDGARYALPPGFSLNGVAEDDALRLVTLIRKYDAVFSKSSLDVGRCDLIPHEIKVTDPTPVGAAYRRVLPHLDDEVKGLLQGLLDQGLIRRSCSNYASAVALVRKKSGALRLCIDYRQLNAKCLKDAFPLPRIEESLEAMGGARLFSSLDLAHGYFQVTMHPDSVAKTAFRVPWGLYEFTRMPQGLSNSPSTFQRVMELIFGELNLSELILYLDDVLVFSKTSTDHEVRLEKVFQRLEKHGLKLNGSKCHSVRGKLPTWGML